MSKCWKDNREYAAEVHGFGSDKWAEIWLQSGSTCMLEEGHEGEHDFVADSDIQLNF